MSTLNLVFVSNEHKEAMEKALEKAGAVKEITCSIEAPLYVLTSIQVFQMESNLEKVFNFAGGYFDPDAVEEFSLSTGERILFGLAINLYNGYVLDGLELSPHQAMGWLSKEHREVCLSALNYRYC